MTAEAARTVRSRGRSIGFATGLYAISFSALATSSGLSVLQAVVLSAVLFSGGSQFAFVGVVASGGSAVSAISTSTLLGIRNTVYGISLTPVLPRGGLRGLARSVLTIDESAANALAAPTPELQRVGFWSAGIWVYVWWNAFTVLGAFLGSWMSDPGAWGLDGAAAAAFIALLWPRLVRREAVALAVAAAFLALILVPLMPPGLPVICAALVAVLFAFLPEGPTGAAPAEGSSAAASVSSDEKGRA
ncbi:AzlC family ABC transporter permease [Helcobacillus massiliensis]|uniref:Putative branched-subunit amino acid permease n=1 Tax=Helcobacillus massiliensis TaxID=521392 RepID=A0A839QSS0_9MICO|nr:AzlC family ABC transporter permease [Helcobacillus massiliensis]MBB3021800.1 putative branched-subunit amino acid permease [Helcobacillus massiliensis]MCT1557870.1 AzlC family ABC transporter permease [Helcobacillus massiliensis]MCT2037361.1 AzlC family ABC transporter permease [Helcobacillus massiliensis]MCT2332105.1 AzlC family ABC transporter permease [Helcobacillus massiliensis]